MGAYIYRLFDNLQHVGARGMNVGWENPARGQPERIIPNNNDNAIVTAVANAWTPWTEISSGEVADYILAGIQYSHILLTTGNLDIQVGIGAAGTETSIYDIASPYLFANPPVAGVPFVSHYERTAFIKIAAHTRISFRVYWKNPGTPNPPDVGIYLALLPYSGLLWSPWNDSYAAGNRATKSLRTPAVPNFISVSDVSYSQIIASAATNLLLHAVYSDATGTSRVIAQLAIATGAAGAEINHAVLPFSSPEIALRGMAYSRPCRPILINAGERIAAKELYSNLDVSGNYAFFFETIT